MGSWPIVANQAAAVDMEKFLPLRDLASRGFVGAKIRGSQIIDDFLAAFYALGPWDGLHDPKYYDELLVPQDRRPSKLLLTKS